MTAEETESRDEKYIRQTKESFEHLGRFVQEFEQVVFTIRVGVRDLLSGNGPTQTRLLDVVLNHQALSAKPLWDMLRGIISEATKIAPFLDEERTIISQILKQTATEFQDLTEIRNTIVHGTWFIGWANPTDDDFSAMTSMKWKVTADGAKPAEETPKNVDDFKALILRCAEVRRTLNALLFSIRFTNTIGGVEKNFSWVDKRWVANSTWLY